MPADMLVVSADAATTGFVRRAVRCWAPGTTLTVCADGRRALDHLAESRYRLALVDQDLTGLCGLEVIRRACGRGIDTPIVLAASHGTRRLALRVAQLGGHDMLQKPLTISSMLALLRDFLDLDSVGAGR